MRNQFIICIFVLVLGFSLIENSFAQKETAPREDPSLREVSLHLQLKNSEGQLVTYLQPTVMYIINIGMVNEFLDTIEDKTIIEKDGEKLEVIQYDSIATFSSTKQIATYGMVYEDTFVLVFRHDGYIVSSGDVLHVSWKIVRPIQ